MTSPPLFLNTDARLIDQIRRGEEEALVTLYQQNRAAIVTFVERNSGTRDDGEDMLQEALVILWERVRTGRYEHTAAIGTFLYATVRNIWLRQLARRRKETRLDDEDTIADDGNPGPLDVLVDQETTARIVQALDTLGDPCRKLLLLFYWEEQTMEEIARVMGFANADTAKSKKYQCKKALEAILQHKG